MSKTPAGRPTSRGPSPDDRIEHPSRLDEALDEALDETFPASDPIAPYDPDARDERGHDQPA